MRARCAASLCARTLITAAVSHPKPPKTNQRKSIPKQNHQSPQSHLNFHLNPPLLGKKIHIWSLTISSLSFITLGFSSLNLEFHLSLVSRFHKVTSLPFIFEFYFNSIPRTQYLHFEPLLFTKYLL